MIHHLPLALATLAAGYALYVTRPFPDMITRLSFASAYPALVLLAATLLIGPWRVWMGARAVLSLDLRRDIGIWAGLTALFHTVIGQCVHLRGRPWLYYVYDPTAKVKHDFPIRHDLFGLANYTGLIAALLVLALLITSSDAMLRKMGADQWKSLQRWNYLGFALVAIHTFAYQKGVENQFAFFFAAVIVVAVTAAAQTAAWRRHGRP